MEEFDGLDRPCPAGFPADPLPLSSGEVDDEDRWTVSGVPDLGYDLNVGPFGTIETNYTLTRVD